VLQLLRYTLAIITGVAVAFILVVGVELFSAIVHPLPADFDGSAEQMCKHVENYPQWILAVVVPMWGVTTFLGAWIAGRIGNGGCALFVGLFLLAMVILNMSMLPYPIWFIVANLLIFPAAIFLAYRYSRRNQSPATPATE